MNVIKGTTPTIEYTFSTVQLSNMTKAIMTIKAGGNIIVQKDMTTATVGQNKLSWTLTQSETLSCGSETKVMLNWLLADGTRGATKECVLVFGENHINEVI